MTSNKKIYPLVFNMQDKIDYDTDRAKINPVEFQGCHDHSQCIILTEDEVKKNIDGDLITVGS
jgi:hypothetical protein